jgi:hypothetical protein
MKEAILEKIEELSNKNYHLTGDIYAVLGELKKFVENYDSINSNTD